MVIEKVTTVGWGQRIKSSLTGFLVGPLLILGAFPVLFSNEGCAVRMYKSLSEVKGKVVSVSAQQVDAANDGKLVHLSGEAQTKDVLTDATFGVSAPGVKLLRRVEMYQVRQNERTETEKKAGGKEVKKTTYSYEHVWASSFIDSSRFEDATRRNVNPRMKYESKDFIADNVTLGAFKLSPDQIRRLRGGEALPVGNDSIQRLQPAERSRAQVADGTLYIGSASNPQVGDLRISYTVVKPGPVSVIAQQQGGSFVPYKTEAGNDISLLSAGTLSPDQMVANAESAEGTRTWIVRVAGFLMFLIGFNLLFKPLAVIGDVLPILGSIVGFGGFVVSTMLAMALSFTTIAVAWLFYRPLISVPLLLLAVGGLIFLIMRGRKTAPSGAAAGTA